MIKNGLIILRRTDPIAAGKALPAEDIPEDIPERKPGDIPESIPESIPLLQQVSGEGAAAAGEIPTIPVLTMMLPAGVQGRPAIREIEEAVETAAGAVGAAGRIQEVPD